MVNTVKLLVVALASFASVAFVTARGTEIDLNIAAGLSSNGDLLTVPLDESDLDNESSKSERSWCCETEKCKLFGGYCVKSRDDCDGMVDPKGCRGRKCKCCIPLPTCPTDPTPCPTDPPTTTPQAECTTICPDDYSPVCGSDGETYSNACVLSVASCLNPTDLLVIAYDGECDTDCSNGCFKIGSQCFLTTTVNTTNWDEAVEACANHGQSLAEPQEPQALSKYLTDNYGGGTYWIGARGTINGNAAFLSGDVIGPDAPWFGEWYEWCDDPSWCMHLDANSGCYSYNYCLACSNCTGNQDSIHTYFYRTPLCTCDIES